MSAKSPSIPQRLSRGLNLVKITFERSETFSQLEEGLRNIFFIFTMFSANELAWFF